MAITLARLKRLLVGEPWGSVFPPRPAPPGQSLDGRTAALEVLRDYVCDLRFFRQGAPGAPPIPFQVRPENFHVEWPDNEDDLNSPSIAVIPAQAKYDPIGLTNYVDEDSLDVFGRGTVLQAVDEYQEQIKLEVHASHVSERRALLAGLETAFQPTEFMAGVRFKMPSYFGQIVTFGLLTRELVEGPDSAKNRRKATVTLDMRFVVVSLQNVAKMTPHVRLDVDSDADTGVEVVLE